MIENNIIIHITDSAISKFKEMIFDSGLLNSYLKISLDLDGTKMFYSLDVIEKPLDDDLVYNYDGLNVSINSVDEELLKGSVIDYITDDFGDSFVIDNPNIHTELEDDIDSDCCGCGCCHH